MSLLGWIICIIACIAVILYTHWEGWKLYGSGAVIFIVGYLIFGSSTGKYEDYLMHNYPNIKEVVSIEKLPSDSDSDYKFTVIEYCSDGITCKQDGFIRTYDNGEVSDIHKYGYPYEFRDRKGNIFHDHTGYGLY